MSLTVPIPQEMRDTLSKDRLMRNCLVGLDCSGRIEWNHGFTYAGKRINELYFLTPLCSKHHREEAKHREAIRTFMRYRILEFKARDDFNAKYPKSDLYRSFPQK